MWFFFNATPEYVNVTWIDDAFFNGVSPSPSFFVLYAHVYGFLRWRQRLLESADEMTVTPSTSLSRLYIGNIINIIIVVIFNQSRRIFLIHIYIFFFLQLVRTGKQTTCLINRMSLIHIIHGCPPTVYNILDSERSKECFDLTMFFF